MRVADRLTVGIVVDGLNNYGRRVARGALSYANARRLWRVHQELRVDAVDARTWPACDGLICAGLSQGLMRSLQSSIPHVVSCSSASDPREVSVVCADGTAIGRVAAQHLIACRLEHFAFYGGRALVTTQRVAGFADAIAATGRTCSISPLDAVTGTERVTHAHWPVVLEWLASLPKPVGILAFDDVAAADLSSICLEAGLRVPDEVAIVGVNNDDLLCESAWPPLSSVEVDFTRVGYLAARQLDGLLRGETLPEAERMTLVPPLGVARRASTDVRAVDDPDVAAAVAFIREHACDPCTVKELLRHVPVARQSLEQRFSRLLGRTPHEEITSVRMERAKSLLVNGDEPLRRVAAQVGFSAPQNFCRAFQQAVGTSPAAFRRQHRRVGG